MEKSFHIANINNYPNHDSVRNKSQSNQCLVAAVPKHTPHNVFKRIINLDQHGFGSGPVAEVGYFLLKLAVLEGVRRFSQAHCPILWHSLQSLQFVCLPPLKWIGKWGVFKGLVKFVQALSRPLLVLSISTSLPDRSIFGGESSDASQSRTDPLSDSQSNIESADSRITRGVTRSQAFKKWMPQLLSELEKAGMVLPERISEDDLKRFYNVANGDFPRFLASIKKTILWRQSFRFLSAQELEGWSEIVFWHGRDVKGHPCLIVRVASACSDIVRQETSCLPKVIASQIEHGLHSVQPEDPRITVLMDCEGLTPFRFPVQMMRSSAILLQDHYPNRLASLFIVRLPPIARVITQTLFQVLRPGTKRKLRVLGRDYKRILSEHLEALPSSLGGKCSCSKCAKLIGVNNTNVARPSSLYEADNAPLPVSDFNDTQLSVFKSTNDFESVKLNKMLKTVVVGLVILLMCIVFGAQVHDLQSVLYSRGGG